MLSALSDAYKRVCTLDVRSLSLSRIVIAAAILVDICIRVDDFSLFYGPGGIVDPYTINNYSWATAYWSFHLAFGNSYPLLYALFGLHAASALALLLGYRTTLASVFTWLLTVSLHHGNLLILQGGDDLLRAFLFIGIFLPWGARYSLDSVAQKKRANILSETYSLWACALVVQIIFLYLTAALFKHTPMWWPDGSALYYTLSIDQMATSVGKLLLPYPLLLTFLTFFVFFIQHAVPMLLISPWRTQAIRALLIAFLIGMHIAFSVSLAIGLFSWITIAGLFALMPRVWWGHDTLRTDTALYRTSAYTVRNALALLCIVHIVVWNIDSVASIRTGNPRIYQGVIATMVGLNQNWRLFAPPATYDGWYTIDATLPSGEHIDLFRDSAPLSYEKPFNVAELYKNERWRKLMMNMIDPEKHVATKERLALWFCRSENSRQRKVTSVRVLFTYEITKPYGTPPLLTQPKILASVTCPQ